MVRIVMDGAGDMPPDWGAAYDIQVIPINIHFGEQTYLQGVDLTNDAFYALADQSETVPKTSQPTPAQFVEFYRRIAQLGDTIFSIHVTSKLSGTFDSAVMAAQELKEHFNIYPIDSGAGSAAIGFMCREARLMQRAGASVQAILDRIAAIRCQVNIVLTLENLEYARKSGRVKALQAALASLLNVKPIVVLRDGVLLMADKVRTRRRALAFVLETIRQRVGSGPVNAAVVHARDPQAGLDLMRRVRQVLNCRELVMTDLSISVAANLGPGTVGVVAYPVQEG